MIFTVNQNFVKVKKSGRLEDDVTFEKTLWVHEQRPKAKQESIKAR